MNDVLMVLGVWFAVAFVVAAFCSMFARTLSGERRSLSERARRGRRDLSVQLIVLAIGSAATAQLSTPAQWESLTLVFLLAALAVASDAAPLAVGRYRFSASFMSILLAAALLGPAPAVAIGILCVGIDTIRQRTPLDNALNNLAVHSTFPLVAGLLLQPVDGAAALAVASVAVGVATNLLNFLLVALHLRVRDGAPVRRAVRDTWLPVLHWEGAAVAVAALTVYGFLTAGPAVIAGFALSLVVLQLLAVRAAALAGGGRTAVTS